MTVKMWIPDRFSDAVKSGSICRKAFVLRTDHGLKVGDNLILRELRSGRDISTARVVWVGTIDQTQNGMAIDGKGIVETEADEIARECGYPDCRTMALWAPEARGMIRWELTN